MDEIIISPHLPAQVRPLRQSPAAVYLARLAVGSRRATEGRLRTIIGLVGGTDIYAFPWERLEYQDAAAIRAQLAERYAPATSNATLAALRGVLHEAWRLGLMSAEQRERACDIKPVRGSRPRKGRALSHDELTKLFRACDDDANRVRGARDAALLAVLYSGGLRRSEAVALDYADWRMGEQSLTVRAGKGNRARTVYLSDFAAQRLRTYIEVRGRETGPLYRRLHKSGTLTRFRLSDQAVRDIGLRMAEQAGTEPFAPHDLRRSTISHLLDAGIDISTVQQIAGHQQVSTTQKYDRRGDETKRRAVQVLNID